MAHSKTPIVNTLNGFDIIGEPNAINNTLKFNDTLKSFEWVQDISELIKADKSISMTKKLLTSGAGIAGAWVEVIAAMPFKSNYIQIILDEPNTQNDYSIDIAIGAIGFEVPQIQEIIYHVSLTGNSIISIPYNFKIEFASGVRISARVTSILATDTVDFSAIIMGT